jgi:hypothetical protein
VRAAEDESQRTDCSGSQQDESHPSQEIGHGFNDISLVYFSVDEDVSRGATVVELEMFLIDRKLNETADTRCLY